LPREPCNLSDAVGYRTSSFYRHILHRARTSSPCLAAVVIACALSACRAQQPTLIPCVDDSDCPIGVRCIDALCVWTNQADHPTDTSPHPRDADGEVTRGDPDAIDTSREGDVETSPDLDIDEIRELPDADDAHDAIEEAEMLPDGEFNSCGGVLKLTVGGESAVVGERCGPCLDGYLVCNGTEDLRCIGARALGPCGTCDVDLGVPGERCGTCNAGAWVCDDHGRLRCENPDVSACGGCRYLPTLPGESCQDGEEDGIFVCSLVRELECVRDAQNLCGGQLPLTYRDAPALPGQTCGLRGEGHLVCQGRERVVCTVEDAPNPCGGDRPLASEPGSSCGPCDDGVWTCDASDPDRVFCEGAAAPNPCGGCQTLATLPGEPCELGGAFVCLDAENVVCAPPDRCEDGSVNACGGCETLPAQPGSACGVCGSGTWLCRANGRLSCVGEDARVVNVCGGCETLEDAPGAPCTRCGTTAFTCATSDAVACGDPAPCDDDGPCIDDADCLTGHCFRGRCAPSGMSFVAPGSFLMGTDNHPDGDPFAELQHSVTLTRAFYMDQTEVTRDAWVTVMGYDPSLHPACASCPIDNVSWLEALEFANARSRAEGLPECFALSSSREVRVTSLDGTPYGCLGYRLPTEAEWEFAYRAGTTTDFYNGPMTSSRGFDANLSEIAWYLNNAGGTPHPVGLLTPNALDLYDMSGNLWEWTWDPIGPYTFRPQIDPLGALGDGDGRVHRGGAYTTHPGVCRASRRAGSDKAHRGPAIGLRLARTVPPGDCTNGRRDGDESDIDCGGSCAACEVGDACHTTRDCAGDAICESGHCLAVNSVSPPR